MMASNVKSGRFKRLESKKSHSWWWDSHISSKNSKWLHDNLEDMDQHVKRMLQLIEEDADSFAKKAEMYYQKRPELISLVEDFHRMYRSLAERYDHVTGELRKNMPSDLQSQSSGVSDVGSEPPTRMPSPDRRPFQVKKSGPRAAGFDFFLGSSVSDLNSKEGDESSTLDSESDFEDDSSVNNYSGTPEEDQGLRRRITELEVELREVKEKLRVHEEITEGSFGKLSNENPEILAKIAMYEEELEMASQKIQVSQKEIAQLKFELKKYKQNDTAMPLEQHQVRELQDSKNAGGEVLDKFQILEEELRITLEKLHESENKVASLQEQLTSKDSSLQNLQEQLNLSQKEVSGWKKKVEIEKREVSKLQDRMGRYKTNLSDRDQEIRGLKEGLNKANKSLSEENEQLKAETNRLLKERAFLEDNMKEMDLRCQTLEDEVRRAVSGKAEVEAALGARIDQLKADIAENNEQLQEVKNNLQEAEVQHKIVIAEKENDIDEKSKHLQELHTAHVNLTAEAEGARKGADELVLRVRELEKEVERKEQVIVEGAEEKREAIRQLCFSLEHYRNGYHRLREAVVGNKGTPVMAS